MMAAQKKTPRPSESYRAARRNNRSHIAKADKLVASEDVREYRGKWNCYPEINVMRQSHIRRRASKYMPHDGGKQFRPTPKRTSYSQFATKVKHSFMRMFRGG